MEKSDFCGRQFGVQKPQQKPVSPQRASPVQEHVRTYMLAGRGEQFPSSRACADIHACRAWRTIGRGAAKSWKPSGMQNLSCTRGNNRNLHYFLPGGKNFADKTTPVLGPFLDPKTGAKSPGHKQIKLRLNEWTPFWGPFLDPKTGAKSPGHKQIKLRLNEWIPFWGPFLDPKTGVVLSAKLWSPSEKKHKFRLFLHVRDRSFPYRWVSRALQRREYLFSTPCEHLCPHMFLNWGGPPWRHRFC